jgi:hypothetical protein
MVKDVRAERASPISSLGPLQAMTREARRVQGRKSTTHILSIPFLLACSHSARQHGVMADVLLSQDRRQFDRPRSVLASCDSATADSNMV